MSTRPGPASSTTAGLLKGKTLGVIRTDTADQQETTDDALIPAIEALGYKVAAEAVLPCPEGSQTCDQQDVAIQRMQDAGVDTVFLVAQTLAGSATVEKAQTLGYKPQWTTIGNNVTNTVAKFYANAKDNYDGAYGIDTEFSDMTPAAAELQPDRGGGWRRGVPEPARTATASPRSPASRCSRSPTRSRRSTAPSTRRRSSPRCRRRTR